MTTRDRSVVMVLGLLAMVAVFWFLLLSPKREDVATLKDEVAAAQLRLTTATQTAGTAAAAKAKYAADYKAVANLGKAVPVDDDVPSLVFQLQNASKASRIEFDSIKLTGASAPAAAPVAPQPLRPASSRRSRKGTTNAASTATPATPAPAAGAGATATAAPAAAGSTTTPTTPGATATPAINPAVAAAQVAFAGLPPGAAVGPAGLPTMPFDFEFSGPFLRLEKLLRKIDAFTQTSGGQIKVNGRLMTIDSISLSGFPEMKATIHATAFLVPPDQGALAGATPAGPAAVPAATGATPAAGAAPAAPVATATPVAGVTK